MQQAHTVAVARTWLNTPYRHQASVRGVGCDCLGLVRGVWRELYGAEPQAMPAYRADWAEVGGRETLLEAARRHLIEVPLAAMRPGDVILFRMTPQAVVKHCAILTALSNADAAHPRMIHAYWGRAVVESWIGPWWARRLAFGFRFPFLPLIEGEGDPEGVEGAAPPYPAIVAPPPPSRRVSPPRHLPRCAGEENLGSRLGLRSCAAPLAGNDEV